MKKIYIVIGILVMFPSMAFASFDQNLKYGMSNSDVSQLQDVLQEQGCLTHSSTGYFGLLTLEAVKCFQTKNNIPNTGYVGVLTRTSLNSIVDTATASSVDAEVQETGTVAPVTTPSVPVSTQTNTQPVVNQPTQQLGAGIPQVQTPAPYQPVTISSEGIGYGTKSCSEDGTTCNQSFTVSFKLSAGNDPIYIPTNASSLISMSPLSEGITVSNKTLQDNNTNGDTSGYFYLSPNQSKSFSATYYATGNSAGGVFGITSINYGTDPSNMTIPLTDQALVNNFKVSFFNN